MEQEHSDLLERSWQEQREIMDRLRSMGGEEYFASFDDLNKAFELQDHCLRCMDEGTPGGVHMAGSGILNKEAAIELVRKAGVEGIYSHEGCGAAALYAKNAGLDVSQADQLGIDWAKELAEQTGLPYQGHIDSGAMARPLEFHKASVVYYDGTGRFDPTRVPGLPAGFIISRKFLSGDYARKEAEIAVGIALGGHGYGDKFTPETPFHLVVVGDQSKHFSVELLQLELASLARANNGRVKTIGFTAPPQGR